MARLVTVGFEGASLYEIDQYSGTVTFSNTVYRSGAYAAKVAEAAVIYQKFPALSTVFAGFALYADLFGGTHVFASFYNEIAVQTIALRYHATGHISIYRGGTLLATSAQALNPAQWYYIEVYYLADTVAGNCTVRVDGAVWVTYAGNVSDSANLNLTSLALNRESGGGGFTYFDDLVINDTAGGVNDTWPGQPKLLAAFPNAAGNDSDFTPSAGANYQCVDEVPISVSDYVASSTVTDVDTYNIDDPLAGTEIITNVVVSLIAKLDSGAGDLDPVVRVNGSQYNGDTKTLTSAWTRYQHCWNVNPDDSNPWEPADIDDLQIGQEVA